jgi:serine/threonine protein kinase
MDFGIAKVLQSQEKLSQTCEILGTLCYMPPEQANGKAVEGKADIYSLGASFYEFFTGKPIFSSKTPARILQDIFQKQPLSMQTYNARIPKELDAIVEKCLQKEPGNRYQTALDLARDLENFSENKPIQAKPAHAWKKTLLWAKRNPLLMLLVLFLCLCLFFCFMSWQKALDAKNLLLENQKHLLSQHYQKGCLFFHQKKFFFSSHEKKRRLQ